MVQTAQDYSEIFCQAVTNIINGEINKLQFDISRECTITDIIDKTYGKYQVTDGSIKFEAVAGEGVSYNIGDKVIVTIPQGDTNNQIVILTKIIDIWNGPAGFVRPLDTLIPCKNIKISDNSWGLLANNEEEDNILIVNLSNQSIFNFHRIGIAAKFKTVLGENIVKGDYGLDITLIKKKDPEKGLEEENILDLETQTFSCNEMLGNPYLFTDYFKQEFAFDVSEKLNRIDEIQISFYQKNNFLNKEGEKLNFKTNGFNEEYKNLFVKDLEIYFGYAQSESIQEKVELISLDDNLEFTGLENETKKIGLKWIHKIDESNLIQITPSNQTKDYEIKWYQYVPNCENKDEYGGNDWCLLNDVNIESNSTDLFVTDVSLNQFCEEEKFKVVCLVHQYPIINNQTIVESSKYVSNILTFKNNAINLEGEEGSTSVSEIINDKLSLHFKDNSYGNYFLYDQNGKLIEDQDKQRALEVYYDNKNIDIIDNIKSIKWEIPNLDESMIYYEAEWNEESEKRSTFNYSILRRLDQNRNNNIIKCIVNMGNKNYYLETELRFGIKGTNGTQNTFILDMLDNKKALIANNTKIDNTNYYDTLSIEAVLINEYGEKYTFTEEDTITWELIHGHNSIKFLESNEPINIKTLALIYNQIPNDNYTILMASCKLKNGPELQAFLPIPIRASKCLKINGLNKIIYDHQGRPKVGDNNIYIGYILENDELKEIYTKWDVQQPNDSPNKIQLKISDGKTYLIPYPLYCIGKKENFPIYDRICVYLTNGNNIIWSQPILIMQSRYDFAMLNEWDGSLQINNGKNTIMATMLGAGRKNDDNTFSGVLLGDVEEGTGLETADVRTGIYGFDKGVIRYALREDGSFLLDGRNGSGGKSSYITVDGDNGIQIIADSFSLSSEGGLQTIQDIAQAKVDTATDKDTLLNNLFNDTNQGIYLDDGYLYINANYIKAGTISAGNVNLKNLFKVYNNDNQIGGHIGYGKGLVPNENGSGSTETNGIKISDSTDQHYMIATDSGIRLQAPENISLFLTESGITLNYKNYKIELIENKGILLTDPTQQTYLNLTDTEMTLRGKININGTLYVNGVQYQNS